jgi:hypothetical protein
MFQALGTRLVIFAVWCSMHMICLIDRAGYRSFFGFWLIGPWNSLIPWLPLSLKP